MKPRDWFLLTFSFAVGFFAGFYIYLTEFRPLHVTDPVLGRAIDSGDVSIIGRQYGGLPPPGYVSPSFRISGDGSYDYSPGGTVEANKVAGKLPSSLFNNLIEALQAADLQTFSGQMPPGSKTCATFADGTEFEYDIIYEGDQFLLDTCLTDFSNETELGRRLMEVWVYLAEPEAFSISVSNTPGGVGENSTRNRGSYWTLRGYFERGFERSGFPQTTSE